MTGRQFKIFVGILLGLALFATSTALAAVVRAEISRLADTSHLEFHGAQNWNYDLRTTGKNEIQISIYPIDDASVAALQSFQDAHIAKIDVDTKGPDGTYILKVKLTNSDVESFHYLTDDPSRLIVDFYKRIDEDAPVKAAKVEPKPQNNIPIARSKTKQATKNIKSADYTKLEKNNRKPAGDEFLEIPSQDVAKTIDVSAKFGIFDGGDDNYDRFRIKDYEIREEAVIASKQNVYLPFPMLKMNASRLGEILERQPEYVIKPKDTRENKEARLLLSLFERKRYGVYLKTYRYFSKKNPKSEYMEILKNITAQIYLTRWRETGESSSFDQARALYTELVQKFPDSIVREHNYSILAFAQLERGDAVGTLQTIEGFTKEYPKSTEVPHMRMALAEAYLILRRFAEAKNIYNEIINDYSKSDHAVEAQYRLGDVDFESRKFGNAITAYEGALKDNPGASDRYANAYFNMGESRFWQKDYKKSLDNLVQFVNTFPMHPYGGYALTRIGELLDILGADPTRVMGAFLESYFRFPNHPGAQIARIRMLSRQMRGMKEKEFKRGVLEIEKIESGLSLEGMKEFSTLMIAEGLTGRAQYRDAIERLVSYFQKNPGSANLSIIKERVLRNISNEIKSLVDSGRFMAALEYYSKYDGNWLKNTGRIDVPFFVAGAFESAGAYPESVRIYSEALKKRLAVVGAQEEKERRIQEHLPSVLTLRLRLSAALVAEREYLEAYNHLKEVVGNDGLSPKEIVESVQLSATVFESRQDHERARKALEQLADTWKGEPALLAPIHTRLAEIYLKLKDPRKAEMYASRALNSDESSSESDPMVLSRAMQIKGEALLDQGRALAAVETLQGLLERYETTLPLSNVRYRTGEILFQEGDLAGAAKVWEKLRTQGNELLWKVGQEKIKDAEFRDEYKKYIDRIPAMVNRSGGGK